MKTEKKEGRCTAWNIMAAKPNISPDVASSLPLSAPIAKSKSTSEEKLKDA